MGWLARVLVSSAAFVVGCASIAGIGEGSDAQDQTSNAIVDPKPGSSGSSGTSGSSGSAGSSGSSGTKPPIADAAVDAVAASDAAPPPCTKVQLGGACSNMNDCCSGFCSATQKCTTSCATAGSECFSQGCCVNTTCSNVRLCL